MHVSRSIPRYSVYTLVLGKYNVHPHTKMSRTCEGNAETLGLRNQQMWNPRRVLMKGQTGSVISLHIFGNIKKTLRPDSLHDEYSKKRRNYQMLLGKLAMFSLPDPTPKATRKIGGSTWQGCRTEQNDMTHWRTTETTSSDHYFWVDWIRLIMVKKGTIQLQSCDLSWLWFGKMADRW